MSVCSETFLLQNLLPLVCADCWEWPPILSYLKCLPQVFTFVSFLGTWSAWGRANASSKLCICLTNQYERCHDSLINPQKHWLCTDAGDWRMSVSAVLTVIVTVHQLIFFFFLLMCKSASASMTTLSTHCISMRIKATHTWRVQAEFLCTAECPHAEIRERNKNGGRVD